MSNAFNSGRRWATVGVALSFGFAASAVAVAARADEQELRISGREHVALRTFVGSVQVAEAPGSDYVIRVRTTRPGIVAETRKDGREVVVRWPRDLEAIHTPLAPNLDAWFVKAKAGYDGHRYQLRRGEADFTADITVLVPRGARLAVEQQLGPIAATAVRAGLRLETGMGAITVERSRGGLVVETGASDIAVRAHDGEVKADTGSGEVLFEGNTGRQTGDTGSGEVRVRGGQGTLVADTGSGEVVVEDFAGDVTADTGSGSVAISGLSQTRRVEADTGSGDVSLQGDLAGLEALRIDTGSGSVSVNSTSVASLRLAVDTGSGGIAATGQARLEGKGDRREIVIGSGAHRGTLSTGSGSIRVTVAP